MAKHMLTDRRSHKVLFVSHCVLNQNAKVYGIAMSQGTIKPVVDLMLEHDVGIYQMTCPEMTYLGAMRWGHVRDQYDSPMFRRHCRQLAAVVVDQTEDYRRNGYEVLGFLMIDGSPVCGLSRVPVAEDGVVVGGMVWYTLAQHVGHNRGVYCQILQEELAARGMGGVPFLGLPEGEEPGPMEDALERLGALLARSRLPPDGLTGVGEPGTSGKGPNDR
ncbi:MAG TPA: hypothetical protein VJK02_02230 [Anaerolineales bacterium]|nr:hypothetical protein [Anaerolineales bacterium]